MQGYFLCSLGGRGWAQLEVLVAAAMWALTAAVPALGCDFHVWVVGVSDPPAKGVPQDSPRHAWLVGFNTWGFSGRGLRDFGLCLPHLGAEHVGM